MQTLFALLCIWIGVEFYQFIQYLETNGAAAFTSRPPGVDGFLPISSFMSFYLFLVTGEIHSAHPAGFFIFFAIVLVSISFWKSILQLALSGWIFIRTDRRFRKENFRERFEASKVSRLSSSQSEIFIARFSFLLSFLFDEHNCTSGIS